MSDINEALYNRIFLENKYTSQIEDVNGFKEHVTWKEIVTVLQGTLLSIHNDLEKCTSEELPYLQGQASMLRILLILPDEMLEDLTAQKAIEEQQ